MAEATSGGAIGPYHLVRQLGEGGMGVVYHARQSEPIRRDVALKVIKPGMDSKQVIARFESERQALAMMDHPNIARVFDAGTTSTGLPYFVMELVDGVPITRYCDSKHLTVRERIELFIPVCQAIQHAHQKGIIHRDIKPSNILVKQQENEAVPKVIDFGLAKALGGQLSDATMMTNLNTVVGTFHYMSPEQAEMGRHDIDTRSDVYSLGAVLYELLTGTTPLERLDKASYVEVLQRIREEETQPPSARIRTSAEQQSEPTGLPRLLDRELDWIAMKALEKHRNRRYETVNGLARDLQRYVEGEPVEAAPPSAAYRMNKFVRKHRVWLATAAAFTALLVAGAVVSAWMAVRANRAEQEARVVNDFLQKDLLAQASASKQARPDNKPDPNLTVRTALDRAAAKIVGKFDKQPLVEASIRQTIGDTYNDLGLYPEAERQIERAVDLRRHLMGEKDPDTLKSMHRLALLYEYRGKHAQAERLLTKVVEIRRHALGQEHPDTLEAMDDLALVYRSQGKNTQAELLYTKVLEVRRRVLGAEHPDTMTTMNNLGVLYGEQGKYAQAEPFFSENLEFKRRAFGEEHPDTLTAMNNLAELYHRLGRFAEAEALMTKVLDVRRRVLGEEHPNTLGTMNNLAVLYQSERKEARAESLDIKVLEGRRRALGEEHPATLQSMSNLALVYLAEGKYTQAEELFTKALEGRRRVLGKEHPATLISLEGLGIAELSQRRYARAEAALREAVSIYQKTAPNNWLRFRSENMLGASLAGQRRYAEAEPLLLSGYDGLVQRQAIIPAANQSAVKDAGERIVQLYQDWGKPDKAAAWKQKLQAIKPDPSH